MNPTILTFRLIKSEIDKYKSENSINEDSRSFLEYVLEKELDIDRTDVLDSIIDGSGDRGIDAIYIDEETEGRPTVYLFQSKYYQSEDKFDRTMEGDALQKMQHAIENLILKSPDSVVGANEFLLSKLRDIKAISNPKFQVIFCSNSSEPNSNAQKQFELFINEMSQGHDFFAVKYIDLKKLAEFITPVTTRKIDAKLRLSGQYFDWSLGEARVLVGRISGKELAELCKKEGKDLFDRNVRGYLGSRKNNVNGAILKTATDQIEGSRFFFLNNGVTIVCSNISYLPQKESPEVEISNLQIVNGGQTTNAIYEAYRSNLLSDSVYVLIKIVATEHKDLIEKITESTNTQTLVKARDLRSNDQIQKTIESMLKNQGYYYETRKDKYKDLPGAKGKRIDMEVAAQAYYAFSFKEAAAAKNKKKQIFGSLYEVIFPLDNKEIAKDILLSFKALEWIRKLHPTYKDKFTFIKYSEFHSLALLGVKNIEDLNKKEYLQRYEMILKATEEVVQEESKRLAEQYSHRILFIDPTTLGRISEALGDLIVK